MSGKERIAPIFTTEVNTTVGANTKFNVQLMKDGVDFGEPIEDEDSTAPGGRGIERQLNDLASACKEAAEKLPEQRKKFGRS